MNRPPRFRAVLAAAGLAAALAAPLTLSGPAGASLPPPPTGWTQVFADDFSGAAGSGLNTADWLYDTGTGYPGGASNWGTGEVETMTSSTANVNRTAPATWPSSRSGMPAGTGRPAGWRPSGPTWPPRSAGSCGWRPRSSSRT